MARRRLALVMVSVPLTFSWSWPVPAPGPLMSKASVRLAVLRLPLLRVATPLLTQQLNPGVATDRLPLLVIAPTVPAPEMFAKLTSVAEGMLAVFSRRVELLVKVPE